MLIGVVAGCASGLAQVPASHPHGRIHIRIVRQTGAGPYEATARVDAAQASLSSLGRAETTVRVKPGTHQVELSVASDDYQLRTIEVARDSRLQPARETQIALVPTHTRVCNKRLELKVGEGSETLALLVLGPGAQCESCVLDDLRAQRCAGEVGARDGS